jgi:hypothetical protein
MIYFYNDIVDTVYFLLKETAYMKTTRYIVLTAMMLFSLNACLNQEASEEIAITNVTVIDAKNGLRERQTVVFEKDRIISVAATTNNSLDVNKIIDGTGKFLIPGLWDMHVHLTYDDAFTEDMPSLFLSYGITSVRDTGGLINKLRPVIEKMRTPDALAPRVFFSGPLLDGKFVVYDGGLVPEIGTQNATVEMANEKIEILKN